MGYPPEYVEVLAEFNSKGKIVVTGTFDKNMGDWAAKQVKDACEGAQSLGLNYVTFVIDSNGGSVNTLQRFVSYMEIFKPNPEFKFIGYVTVEAYSAAFDLLQYCDWRVAHSGATILLHYGRIEMTNSDQAILYENPTKAFSFEKARLKESIALISKRSGLSEKKIHEMCKKDLPITANQALKLGFLDEVVETLPEKSMHPNYVLN